MLWSQMNWKERLVWVGLYPVMLLSWPIIWLHLHQNSKCYSRPPHALDEWLVAKGHVIMTRGRWFWEKK